MSFRPITRVLANPNFIAGLASTVLGGIILMMVSGFLGILSFVWAGAGAGDWRDKVWEDKATGKTELFGYWTDASRMDIVNLPEGSLKIEIVNDFGTTIQGNLICLDHGKSVGQATVKFLPRNEIHVVGSGNDGYNIDLLFVAREPNKSRAHYILGPLIATSILFVLSVWRLISPAAEGQNQSE